MMKTVGQNFICVGKIRPPDAPVNTSQCGLKFRKCGSKFQSSAPPAKIIDSAYALSLSYKKKVVKRIVGVVEIPFFSWQAWQANSVSEGGEERRLPAQ